MLDYLGLTGIVGALALLAGIALIAYENLLIAAGIALAIAGLGLVVRSLLRGALDAMGMGGLV